MAIGGITLDRAADVIAAGAAAVAVIGDLLATGDPGGAGARVSRAASAESRLPNLLKGIIRRRRLFDGINCLRRNRSRSCCDEMAGENRLRRVLGPVQLTSLGVGAIIGAGIFVATGAAAHNVAGPALMLSYVLAGVTCIFAALCYAEFASMVPVAGSAYTYAYATLGELFAWIIGWDLVLEYAVGVGDRRERLVGLLSERPGEVRPPSSGRAQRAADRLRRRDRATSCRTDGFVNLPAILIVAIVTIVLVKGIQESAGFNATMVVLKLAAVLFVILVGAFYVNPDNWTPFAPFGMTGVSFFGNTAVRADERRRAAGRHACRRGDHLLRVHRVRLGLHPRGGSEEPQARCADRHHRVAADLHGALHRRGRGAHRHGAATTSSSVDAGVSDAFKQAGLPWAEFIIAAAGVAGITSVLLVLMLSAPRVLPGDGARRHGAALDSSPTCIRSSARRGSRPS